MQNLQKPAQFAHSRRGAMTSAPRKLLRNWLRGGGFVPQSLIDSVQLTDSTMVRNAKKGHKGNFFIQFSFSFHRVMVPMRVLLSFLKR